MDSALEVKERFGGIARLYGEPALKTLAQAHVCIIGIGGVGSWTAEALARSGVGAFTLVDLDEICVSNINRQIHAQEGTVGRSKIAVMAERIQAVNPVARVISEERFFTAATAEALLAPDYSMVVDAIDRVTPKCMIVAGCRQRRMPVVTVGGAGGRRDPTAIRCDDLSRSLEDPLLMQVRKKLRREFGFPRDLKKKFKVDAVFSLERPVYPEADGGICNQPATRADLRLNCDTGYGTSAAVTGTYGLVAASVVLRQILSGR